MIDGSEKRNRQLPFEHQNSQVGAICSNYFANKESRVEVLFYWYNGDLASRVIASYRYLAINE